MRSVFERYEIVDEIMSLEEVESRNKSLCPCGKVSLGLLLLDRSEARQFPLCEKHSLRACGMYSLGPRRFVPWCYIPNIKKTLRVRTFNSYSHM